MTCLDDVLRLRTFVGDAEHAGADELADRVGEAWGGSRGVGEQGKALLRARLGS